LDQKGGFIVKDGEQVVCSILLVFQNWLGVKEIVFQSINILFQYQKQILTDRKYLRDNIARYFLECDCSFSQNVIRKKHKKKLYRNKSHYRDFWAV
jgi:hypothetical protein